MANDPTKVPPGDTARVRGTPGGDASIGFEWSHADERGMVELRFSLPLPPPILSPNNTSGWRKKAAAKKAYKETAYICAKEAIQKATVLVTGFARAKLTLRFHYARRNWMADPDNAVAAFKAGLDGLVAAGLIPDDRARCLVMGTPYILLDPERPRVEVILERLDDGDDLPGAAGPTRPRRKPRSA